jgi:hypothetical protein
MKMKNNIPCAFTVIAAALCIAATTPAFASDHGRLSGSLRIDTACVSMLADNFSAQRVAAQAEPNLTGDMVTDLVMAQSGQDNPPALQTTPQTASRKNAIVGGLMSLAVPGAGEVYAGEYTKAAVFFVAEMAGITWGILYDNKGDRRTNEFQDYANIHWSAVKYAEFLNNYAAQYRTNKDNAKIDLTAPRDVLWAQINAYESEGWDRGFSHKLPIFGEQQYYELIGKYDQFKYGWDTYPVQANGIPADDHGNYNSVPQQLLDYAANRGSANNFYTASRLAFSLVVVNHLLSAVDAYLSTHHYNTQITSHMSMDLQRAGDHVVAVPQLSVSVGL